MAQYNVFSPAKINLFLAITGRREDGFHDLVSLVAPLSFGDDINVSISEGARSVSLKCDVDGIPTDGSNLICRAANLFMDRYSIDAAIDVDLTKRIPSGAGLGGGSSNAAVVLKVLNEHFGACSEEDLSELSADIGSDCPLFLYGEPVVVRGRGEIIERLTDEQKERLRGIELLLYKPSLSISTPWAYGQLASSNENYISPSEANERLVGFLGGSLDCSEFLYNSFERPVFRKSLGIREMQQSITEEIAVPVLMSGSGSCCFAMCSREDREAVRELVIKGWGHRVFIEAASIVL